MNDKRELEGIGCHYYDNDNDCLLVDRWIKRPGDLKGQALNISILLPVDVRCMDFNKENHKVRVTQKFKF